MLAADATRELVDLGRFWLVNMDLGVGLSKNTVGVSVLFLLPAGNLVAMDLRWVLLGGGFEESNRRGSPFSLRSSFADRLGRALLG